MQTFSDGPLWVEMNGTAVGVSACGEFGGGGVRRQGRT